MEAAGGFRSHRTEFDDCGEPAGGSQNFTRSELDLLDCYSARQARQHYVNIVSQSGDVRHGSGPESRELCSLCVIAISDNHRKSGGDRAARVTRPKVSEFDES